MAGLKVAHVTATFPPYQGGTGNVCLHNVRELALRRHNVHVYTPLVCGAQAVEVVDGFTIHRVKPFLSTGNAAVVPGLVAALKGFDVIHLHYPFFGGDLMAALGAKLHRIPLVITYHQDVLLSGWMRFVEKLLRLTAGRLALRSAKRLLFTSQDYSRASYVYPLLRGIEARIDEMPNGVDLQVFTPEPQENQLRMRHGLSENVKVALLVASLDRAHYFKGVEVFLHALHHSPAHITGLILGDGELRSSYESKARALGLANRVVFAGRVSNDDLPGYYRLADVTVLPSLTMGEAFGLVLLESLACGTPVIASNLPGVRTVVDAGRDGLLVEPGDTRGLAEAIQHILGDETRRLDMGKYGRARVERLYDWKQIGSRLEAVYQQVLGQDPGHDTRCHLA